MEIRTAHTPPSEFSPEFIQMMIDRMGTSCAGYGPIKDAFPDKVDSIDTLKLRLKQYMETGNTEFLVDVANYAMIEFIHPKHPKAFFKATDSKGSPGRVWNNGMSSKKRNDNET